MVPDGRYSTSYAALRGPRGSALNLCCWLFGERPCALIVDIDRVQSVLHRFLHSKQLVRAVIGVRLGVSEFFVDAYQERLGTFVFFCVGHFLPPVGGG